MSRLGMLFGVALAVTIAGAAVLLWLLVSGSRSAAPRLAQAGPGVLEGAAPLRAILVESAATRAHFTADPGARANAYDARLAAWETRLAAAGVAFERRDVGTLAADAAPLLVVPAAAALSEAEVAAIVAAAESGAGVLATWQFALHRPDGSWRGYGALERLAGLEPLAEPEALEAAALRFLAIRGDGPLAAGVPAGARLEVPPYDAPLLVQAPDAAADWVRWEILPLGPPERPVLPTAMVARRLGRGRVVWLGFDPGAVVATGDAPAWVDRTIGNALAWLGQRPLVAVERWPAGARAASMLGLDVEMGFDAGRPVAARARAAGMPLTSFVVSMLARDDATTVAALAGAGEIASHTHDHRPLAGRTVDEQVRELEASRDLLQRLVGRPVVGLRPPEERADAATSVALVRAGYRYVAGLPDKDRAEPTIVAVDDGALTVVPRIPHDDYEWVVRRPLGDPARVAAAMEADRAYVTRLGGVWFFDFHTQYAADPGIAAGVDALLARPPTPDEWRATGAEIAAWWGRRAGVVARLTSAAADAVVLHVHSREAMERVAAEIHAPDAWRGLRVAEPAAGVAVVAPAGPARPFRVELHDLGAGESRRIVLQPD